MQCYCSRIRNSYNFIWVRWACKQNSIPQFIILLKSRHLYRLYLNRRKPRRLLHFDLSAPSLILMPSRCSIQAYIRPKSPFVDESDWTNRKLDEWHRNLRFTFPLDDTVCVISIWLSTLFSSSCFYKLHKNENPTILQSSFHNSATHPNATQYIGPVVVIS